MTDQVIPPNSRFTGYTEVGKSSSKPARLACSFMRFSPIAKKLVTSNSDIEERHASINELLNTGVANKWPLATFIRPFQLNLRVAAQQGVFAVPLSDRFPLEKCLLQSALKSKTGGALMHKITITDYSRTQILREIRLMNITHQTLFPGLDGFAKSLQDQLATSADGFFL